MSVAGLVTDFTTVVAKNQTQGKGQMGSAWLTEKGKNLTFSVFVDISFLKPINQFYFNCAVSLSIYTVLKKMQIPKLSLKWPNDILSSNHKISGILIENSIQANKNHAIIGVGLNVNQKVFEKHLNASSLKNITGVFYNLDEVLQMILEELQNQIKRLHKKEFKQLHQEFEAVLFRKNKPSTFKNAKGELFVGFIKGISKIGNLQVLLEDDITEEFRLKEVQLLY